MFLTQSSRSHLSEKDSGWSTFYLGGSKLPHILSPCYDGMLALKNATLTPALWNTFLHVFKKHSVKCASFVLVVKRLSHCDNVIFKCKIKYTWNTWGHPFTRTRWFVVKFNLLLNSPDFALKLTHRGRSPKHNPAKTMQWKQEQSEGYIK